MPGFGDVQKIKKGIIETLKVGEGTYMEIDPGPVMDVPVEKVQTWLEIARKLIAKKGKL